MKLCPALVLALGAHLGWSVPSAALAEPAREARAVANGFYDSAEACYRRHELPCALEALRKALATDKRLLVAHVLLAKVLLEGGNPDAAEAAVDRALALSIDRSVLAPTLARALLLRGQPERLFDDARLGMAG
ncbi:MAG TPA: hypothetical protein VK195_12240, partial [Burkholderiaceae bacterium]|nr:hypothetical protein [Burkholderiaceae bacterium]